MSEEKENQQITDTPEGAEQVTAQSVETDPLTALQKELDEVKDQHLRLYAEFENFKRRTRTERADLIKSAGSDIISSMLTVLDDFDRALKAMGNAEENPVREGIVLIHQKMIGLLEQRGLKAMDASGQVFDADLHDAITNIPVQDENMKGKVVEEVEKGYWLNDKVLRFAKVVVGQ